MRRRIFTVSLFMLLAVGLFSQSAWMGSPYKLRAISNPTQESAEIPAEIAKIVAYHDQIDAYAKAYPTAVRYFSAEQAEDGTEHWKEYKTRKELPVLQTHASVWMKDGRVVATILSFKSDHTNSTDGSYFRPDGTLAYREIHGYSIGLDPPLMQSKSYYSSDGKLISSKMSCSVDGQKWAACKKGDGTLNDPSENADKQLFKKNTDLPFFNLLAKGQ